MKNNKKTKRKRKNKDEISNCFDNIIEIIRKLNNFLIITHISPDGDAVGSAMALYQGLKQIKKDVEIVLETIPENFLFLKKIDEVNNIPKKNKYDVIIILDSSGMEKVYWGSDEVLKCFESNDCKSVLFDHHITNGGFAKKNYIERKTVACSQIVLKLLKQLEIEITKDISDCLLLGIATDTNFLKNKNTSFQTIKDVSYLFKKGSSFYELSSKIETPLTYAVFKVSARVRNRMRIELNGKVSFSFMYLSDLNTGIKNNETKGFVNIGKRIEGIEVSVFLKEQIKYQNWKVTLKSNGNVNVANIVLKLNSKCSGGHEFAAGCWMYGELYDVKKRILDTIAKEL